MVSEWVEALTNYAITSRLAEETDRVFLRNQILALLSINEFTPCEAKAASLPEVLAALCNDAVHRGVIEDTVTCRDLFDTKLMGVVTPRPAFVQSKFQNLYNQSPKMATDWYYQFSQDTNYIRRDRIAKDVQWVTETPYGPLDITINLSKPEKDPKEIAAAKLAPASGYPKCLLCQENEGYAGHLGHPARQNHRLIPVRIAGESWALQFSPYVYYNEHCILLNREHTPMAIDHSAFVKLLDFVGQFPHYFVGSNADLPIVGGSILSHEHFQGGCYEFAMAKAPIKQSLSVNGFDGTIGIVNWPMSVLRISHADPVRLADLAEQILLAWRGYTDASAFIYAETDGTPHNTITPIARRRDKLFEMDLVLRNNITTEEHPLGVFHPHAELHHIKKENIGLIEVMGLAVLPSRLKTEMELLVETVLNHRSLTESETLKKHATWVAEWLPRHPEWNEQTAMGIVQEEIGKVFSMVLEHAGVFKHSTEGEAAFLRFIEHI